MLTPWLVCKIYPYLECTLALKAFLNYYKFFSRTSFLSVGLQLPLFQTSGDISEPGWVDPSTCEGFLRFSSGATPADLLAASTEADPFYPLHS